MTSKLRYDKVLKPNFKIQVLNSAIHTNILTSAGGNPFTYNKVSINIPYFDHAESIRNDETCQKQRNYALFYKLLPHGTCHEHEMSRTQG